MAVFGCQNSAQPLVQAVQIEDELLGVLEEMTRILATPSDDPEQNLTALRRYVQASKARIERTVQQLNKDRLALPEAERAAWKKAASDRVKTALDAYANAQIQLKKRMNDAQKWELNEILGALS